MSICEEHTCSVSSVPAQGARPEPAQQGGYRATLGRASWLLMHEMANNLPCSADLPTFYSTVRGIVHIYPCGTCRDNAQRIIQSEPFSGQQPLPEDSEEARRVARLYVSRLHAAVTANVARTGGYVSDASAEYARVYLAH